VIHARVPETRVESVLDTLVKSEAFVRAPRKVQTQTIAAAVAAAYPGEPTLKQLQQAFDDALTSHEFANALRGVDDDPLDAIINGLNWAQGEIERANQLRTTA
jgi:hypothetical protein